MSKSDKLHLKQRQIDVKAISKLIELQKQLTQNRISLYIFVPVIPTISKMWNLESKLTGS